MELEDLGGFNHLFIVDLALTYEVKGVYPSFTFTLSITLSIPIPFLFVTVPILRLVAGPGIYPLFPTNRAVVMLNGFACAITRYPPPPARPAQDKNKLIVQSPISKQRE